MQETLVQFLDWEDPLEKGKAAHSSILAWRIPWTIQSMGLQRQTRLSDFPIQHMQTTFWASLVAQSVEKLPAVQETWVRFLCWKDLLEKEMATHSSILAWKIPWTEEPGRVPVHGVARV